MIFLTTVILFISGFNAINDGKLQYHHVHFASPWPRFHGGNQNRGIGFGSGAAGKIKWKISRHSSEDIITSSPIIGPENTVYFGSPDHNIYAIDSQSGKERWHFETGQVVAASPAIGTSGRILYVGSLDNKVYAIDAISGKEKWTYNIDAAVFGCPAVHDSSIYIGSFGGEFYALDSNTGKLRWKFTLRTGDLISSSPALSKDGLVLFGSYSGKLYALDQNSGRERWIFNASNSKHHSAIL
jgi:outer membrane protein assembly factor BamB